MKTAKKVFLLLIITIFAGDMVAASQEADSARKFDEYGDIGFEDEKARLDNIIVEMKRDQNAVGYLIVYGGRVSVKGIAKTRALRAKSYLVKKGSLTPDRIVWIDGGYREELTTELYIGPRGATAPGPSPSVDLSEVKFVKATNAKKAKPKAKPAVRKTKSKA
ncbi:MAG: hypothetical protein WBV94_21005 [Blastocatellia bacterium]